MYPITDKDLFTVYKHLKDRYEITLTTTDALDEGFTISCPILVGKAHDQIIELYNDGGLFVLDVMDAQQTMGTHWHPDDAESAIDCIIEFMEGKADYPMYPFKQI